MVDGDAELMVITGDLSDPSVLPSDERGLLPGLVEGDTSRLDPRLQQDFRRTGLTHLVAVSGTGLSPLR